MSQHTHSVNRRDFMKTAASLGATLGVAGRALGARPAKASAGRVVGANDRINVGVIGVGGRGEYLARVFAGIGERTNGCKIAAVCDVYEKRKKAAADKHGCDGYLDYREVLNRQDIDAVVVATPDHWHAKIALEAMDRGKDVYLEKPMCHTIEEAKQLAATVKETRRVLQVGSQTTSADQWHKAKKAIADGMIGEMLESQGSYHRNSVEGEWNWDIDPGAGPTGKGENYIDWKMWLGPAPKRAWDADRYFRFRKYWDYSGGIATDLFFHVVAPLNICWPEPQFPHRVMASGGIYVYKDREVPDTFNLLADYPKGHSLVLSSSMANSKHIPGLIRGHEGSIIMVDHGEFEGRTDHITVIPEKRVISEAYKEKWGSGEFQIPVEAKPNWIHMQNFLDCVRSRQKPMLDVETALRVQVTITMAVDSYREGRVLYWDEKNMKVTAKPVKA
ncbi:MAG: Gfo/Idh/MocA family oxidoreductase [Candidatus Solibacter usitatus]|nr:Gfo/Idh/MocA family oxidoreductase [Candidatus Solibacter usitatus]